ncbi:MAG: STAS domain-containing protein, partial [Clostridia bacterium]|nr:STAS domain-containing protein [Clostridia bacterium]
DQGFENEENKIILDFKNVEYMSSAGLRVVLYAKKCIDEDGVDEKGVPKGFIKLVNVSDEILEVFEMTGFSDFLSINEDS